MRAPSFLPMRPGVDAGLLRRAARRAGQRQSKAWVLEAGFSPAFLVLWHYDTNYFFCST